MPFLCEHPDAEPLKIVDGVPVWFCRICWSEIKYDPLMEPGPNRWRVVG